MVINALLKKSIRDMKKSLPQFVSIFVMATVAIAIVSGLDSIWKTMQTNSSNMYAEANLSDMWVSVVNPTEKDMWAINNIAGIESTEKRFTVNAIADLEGAPTLKIYTKTDESNLDLPYIKMGTIKSKAGAILDETFANAQGLNIGDPIKIEVNDRWISFNIEALALNSEHIFSIKDSAAPKPDPNNYGFIIVDEDKIKNAYGGQKIYNQISIRLNSDADPNSIKKEIDTLLGEDSIAVLTRQDNRSISEVDGKVALFKTLSRVFPFMFFIITALVTLSTMTRLVEDQRSQIGILKAMGYSKKSIVWHYTSYGVYVGVLGSIAGIIIGPNLIGKVIIDKLKFMYVFQTYDLTLNIKNIVFGSILIIVCTAGVSCYSCLKMMGAMPAILLRTAPPKKGNHIFLEKIPFVWNRMKFSSKLIARNTLKNKSRMIMSIIGVMGCTGLIITAFALNDLVDGIQVSMYEKTYSYDNKIMLDEKVKENDIYNLHLDGITQDVEENIIQVVTSNGKRKIASVNIFTPESPLIDLRTVEGEKVILPDDGVVITRKLAETMSIQKGDIISVKPTDNSYIEVEVKEIIYMVVGQGVFVSKSFWDSIGETFKPSTLLVKWHHEDTKFLESNYVKSYISRKAQQAEFGSNLAIVTIAIGMLITAGGILAFVVLYNLGILNFFERTRDLATLKVLGFYEKEIRSLVLFENILSAILGVIAGIPIGEFCIDIIASGFGDEMDMISHINGLNILMAGGITFLFALIVNLVVTKKINTIDMLQALKSVE